MCTDIHYCGVESCDKPAEWVLQTETWGRYAFCAVHVQDHPAFGNPDFSWEEISAPSEGKYESLQLLAEYIHRKQYDKVAEFYRDSAKELARQAAGDRIRGRHRLASLLEEAAGQAKQQHLVFARIWALCKPHMQGS